MSEVENNRKVEAEAQVGVILEEDVTKDLEEKKESALQSLEAKRSKKNRVIPIAIVFVSFVLSIWFKSSDLGQSLDEKFTMYIEFFFRDKLGKMPEVDPRIKIVVFGDVTLSRLKRSDLSIAEWAQFLKEVSSRNPKAILIDKVFAIAQNDKNDRKAAEEIFKTIETPIYSGAFVSPAKIPGRPVLTQNSPPVQRFNNWDLQDGASIERLERKGYLNGPDEFFHDYFTAGHIMYEGSRKIAPFFKISSSQGGEFLLPHISLRNGRKFVVQSDQVSVDEHIIPLHEGYTFINFTHPGRFLRQGKTLVSLLNRPAKIKKFIQEGDYVLLMPTFFTGSGDFKPSPYGRINGGFYLLYTLNAMLRDDWIRYVDQDMLFLALGSGLGILAFFLGPIATVAVFLGFPLIAFAISILLFVYFSLLIPWPYVIIAFLLSSLIAFGFRRSLDARSEIEADKIRKDYKVMISENLLLEAQRKTLLKEKKEAARIAACLKPDDLPVQWMEVDVKSYHTTFDAASGDWFSFQESTDGNLLHTILCDITGHGVQAAIVASSCKSVLSTFVKSRPDLLDSPEFLKYFVLDLNAILFKHGAGIHMTTFCGITILKKERKIRYVCCGHPPIIKREVGNERIKLLKNFNNPVGFDGVLPGLELKEEEFNPKDQIAAFTDGLPLNEFFKITKEIFKHSPEILHSPSEMVAVFNERLLRKGKKIPDDDVSLVTLSFD